MIASKFVDCNVLHGYLGNIINDFWGLCDFCIMWVYNFPSRPPYSILLSIDQAVCMINNYSSLKDWKNNVNGFSLFTFRLETIKICLIQWKAWCQMRFLILSSCLFEANGCYGRRAGDRSVFKYWSFLRCLLEYFFSGKFIDIYNIFDYLALQQERLICEEQNNISL